LEENICRNGNIGGRGSEDRLKFEWLDYPRDPKRLSLDGEHKGIDFFDNNIRVRLAGPWARYWPQTGTPPTWDGIVHIMPLDEDSTVKAQWGIVEAKAHLEELKGPCGAKDPESLKMIDNAFAATQERFHIINPPHHWREGNDYYQLANRLAFVNFLLDNGIEARLLYIYFINGWPNDPQKNVTRKAKWRDAIDTEYAYLGINGINDEAKRYISEIFVEC